MYSDVETSVTPKFPRFRHRSLAIFPCYKYSRYTTFRKFQQQKFILIATSKHCRLKNVTILGICKCKKGILHLIHSNDLLNVIFELSTIKLGCTPICINFFCVIMILGGIYQDFRLKDDSRHALFRKLANFFFLFLFI